MRKATSDSLKILDLLSYIGVMGIGHNGTFSGNISWIRLFPEVSIVDRWIVTSGHSFEFLVLLISVAFHVLLYCFRV